MKIAALIVTFCPEKDLLRQNIDSFIDHVDRLLIWDNTPGGGLAGHTDFDFLTAPNIRILGNGENTGVGYALNQGVEYARKHGFTHILTLDQDSCFEKGAFAVYKEIVEERDDDKVAAYAPVLSLDWLKNDVVSQDEVSEVDNAITSGSIYLVPVFKETGLFREDFFIDAIDTEYCLRALKAGFRFYRVNGVKMLHALGSVTVQRRFFHKVNFNYLPMRCYYFARNHYIVCSAYPSAKRWFFYWKSFFYRNLSVVLFESGRRKKTGAYFRGLYDGIRRKTGICKRYHR